MNVIVESPTGLPIIGTLEMTPGCALTHDDGFTLGPNGLAYDYIGETDVCWDGQETVTREGKVVFLDMDGGEWTEDQLVFKDPATKRKIGKRRLAALRAQVTVEQGVDRG